METSSCLMSYPYRTISPRTTTILPSLPCSQGNAPKLARSVGSTTLRILSLNRPACMQLSLTGITFVASSGDSGVSYSGGLGGCLVNGTVVGGNPNGSFVGQFPASCPYVTAVGATSVVPGNSVSGLRGSHEQYHRTHTAMLLV